ncbi:MAG: SDR family oxidoreductase [bacterium]|nr:SDR family oxidoreductase [bacterium]
MDIAGKTALVTGAAKRLGRSVAEALAAQGANVVVHYRSSAGEAAGLVKSLEAKDVRAWAIQADLEDPDAASKLVDRAIASAGALDILVNSASIFPESALTEFTPDELYASININALAPLVLGRGFAAQEREGTILNFLDCRIQDYDARHAAYHLSKRMLFTLTRMMALEFAPRIRVNAVAPGLVLPPAGEDESYLRNLAHTNPLNSHGSAEDIVQAALFLIGSPFVTGQVVYVDGGRHMIGSTYG